MKKILVILVVLSHSLIVSAQKSKVNVAGASLTNGKIDQAKKAIDEAVEHEKSKDLPKAWKVYGDVYRGIFESPIEAFNKLDKKPLQKAYKGYLRALELDEKGKYNKQIKDALLLLQDDFTVDASKKFGERRFKNSLSSFKVALEINEIPVIKEAKKGEPIDTSLYYNTGLVAYNAKEMKDVITYLTVASEYKYGEYNTFLILKEAYLAEKDTANALATLEKAYKSFPNNNTVTIELINFYLQLDKADEALKNLNAAIENDPNNPSLYFVKGTLMDQKGETEKAIELYKKTLSINPTYFNAQYNLAVIKLKEVEEKNKEINEIVDPKKFNPEYNKIIKRYLNDVIPLFEKAHELNPTERTTIQVLKELYFKFRNSDETLMDKHKAMEEKLEKLKE